MHEANKRSFLLWPFSFELQTLNSSLLQLWKPICNVFMEQDGLEQNQRAVYDQNCPHA